MSKLWDLSEHSFKTRSLTIVYADVREIEVHHLPTVSQPSCQDSSSFAESHTTEVQVCKPWEQ